MELTQPVGCSADVGFGGHNCEGALIQRFVVGLQFLTHDLQALDRLLGRAFGDVDEVEDERRPFNVAEKLKAKALSFGRAFDQSGNIRDDEAAVGRPANDTEVGNQRGEGVVGDLRTRR